MGVSCEAGELEGGELFKRGGFFGGEGWLRRGSWEDGYFSKVTQRASLWS